MLTAYLRKVGAGDTALGRQSQIGDYCGQKARCFATGHDSMVEGQAQGQHAVYGGYAGDGQHLLVQASGAENGHSGWDHDRRRVLAAQHAEIRQSDGVAAQFLGRNPACGNVRVHPVEAAAQVGGIAVGDIAQHRNEQALGQVDGDADVDLGQ